MTGLLASVLVASVALAQPQLTADAIEDAADHSTGRVSPGEILVLHPRNVGPEVLIGAQLDPDGKVATLIGETRVWFDEVPAPLAYASRDGVGAVAPYEIAGRERVNVVVEYRGVRSAPVTIPVLASTPALFTLDGTGRGQAAMLNATGCCNSVRNPALRGANAALYATGAGDANPGLTGSVSAFDRYADYPRPKLPVSVTVGGKPAPVFFGAEAPHAVSGLLQVNFHIPDDTPEGDAVPLVLTVGGVRSREDVTMAIRSPVRRVIVVDPDPTRSRWLTGILRGAGYSVITDRSAAVDLAIVNARSANLDGMHAARLAVIVDAVDAASLRRADLLGAQAVLQRPLTRAAVLRRVEELVRARAVIY